MASKRQTQRGAIRVGIAGWKYEPWRGVFYPKGLTQKRELEYASRALPCIEINSTFYRLQQPKSFAAWYAQTPEDFVFSVKAPKLITHQRRLREVETPIANFFASGLLGLKEKLGPVLWQLPPNFRFKPEVLEPFLAQLPHDTSAALEQARRHDKGLSATLLHIDQKRPLRHALEVRHESFVTPAFIDMLRQYKVAMVMADTGGRWPEFEDVCADFIYLRLHGDAELYASGYTPEALDRLASRIDAWSRGKEPADARRISDTAAPKATLRDVFCYFDNTVKEKAPLNAAHLLERLGIPHTNTFDADAPPAGTLPDDDEVDEEA